MFFRKCLNKQYAAQSRVCFSAGRAFSLERGEQRKRRIKSGRNRAEGGGRDDEGGKGGGVFNMGIKSMYI